MQNEPLAVEAPTPIPDERDLVSASARGDSAEFEALYERHARGVYNMVLRSVREPRAAEDLCQEIWMKAHRELPRLREPAAFSLWLYRIAGKTCIDASRKRTRRPTAEVLGDELADRRDDPEAAALRLEDGRLVWEALAALPPKQHLALFLKEVEGRSYQEIAAVLKMSVTAVGLCLMRGRRSFGRIYERMSGAATSERCGRAQTTMAALIDGEATEVQRRGVLAHVDACRACGRDLNIMRQGSRGYASLALAPVPALLSARILSHTAAAAAVAGGGAGIGKVVATFFMHAKPMAITLTAGGALTAAALLTPGPPIGSRVAAELRQQSASPATPTMDDSAASGGAQPPASGQLPAVGALPRLPVVSQLALPPIDQLVSPAGTASAVLGSLLTPVAQAPLPPLPPLNPLPVVPSPVSGALTPTAPLLPQRLP